MKTKAKKRILFLADRNILVDQARNNDFKHFKGAMTKITNRKIDKSYEIYLALYQAVTGTEDLKNIYKEFSSDFFDLIIIDECHRGSAAENSAWREVLEYFQSMPYHANYGRAMHRLIGNDQYFGRIRDISMWYGDVIFNHIKEVGKKDTHKNQLIRKLREAMSTNGKS